MRMRALALVARARACVQEAPAKPRPINSLLTFLSSASSGGSSRVERGATTPKWDKQRKD